MTAKARSKRAKPRKAAKPSKRPKPSRLAIAGARSAILDVKPCKDPGCDICRLWAWARP